MPPRRSVVLLLAMLAGCAPRPAAGPALPERAGEWSRQSHREAPAGSAPEGIARFGLQKVELADYAAPGGETLRAEAYQLASGAAGLELEQTWRREPNTVAFHVDRYFVILRYTSADRSLLNGFVREVQRHLTPR
jgi:hypothetical protein